MLQLDTVTFRNGSFRLSADLKITPGSKVAVMGPSGAGKSTLINGIAGFHDATGLILWDGQDISALSPGKRPVTMLFQDGNLFPHLTIRDNVGLGINPNLRLSDTEWAQVDQALDRVGLGDLGARQPANLSGGQQSRAALARALVQNKPVLLLDEPFAALGPALKHDMLDLVSDLVSETGKTMLMVTHDPGDPARIAEQIVLVADGVAQPPHPTKDMLENPPPALQAYLGQS